MPLALFPSGVCPACLTASPAGATRLASHPRPCLDSPAGRDSTGAPFCSRLPLWGPKGARDASAHPLLFVVVYCPAGCQSGLGPDAYPGGASDPGGGLTGRSQQLTPLARYIQVIETAATSTSHGLNGPPVVFTGANVHIRSGSGVTHKGRTVNNEWRSEPLGLGNLRTKRGGTMRV